MDKFEFAFFSLHTNGVIDAINRAGADGYQFAGAAADVVILTRKAKGCEANGHKPVERSPRGKKSR